MTTRTYGRVISVMGSPSVGKSALLLRLLENRFTDDYIPTIARTNYCDFTYEKNTYQLQIYDTAGLETYSQISSNYIATTNGYILVYSIADRHSFETIKIIYNNLVEANNKNVPVVLVGNKSDLDSDRRVKYQEGDELARQWRYAKFVETSAKVGDGVNEIFKACLYVINSESNSNISISDKPRTPITNPSEGKQGGSCTIS